jgi:aspartate kinase
LNPIVVQKYGGSSLATAENIRKVAARIVETVASGRRVVAVVSAMGGTTDELLARAKELSPNPNPRELDMLLSVGERISTAMLGIALGELGIPAVSLTGSQAGIITNARHNRARIVEVRAFRVMDALDAGKVVIVAGYQGVSYSREITTLGRGGTDTTAVALAAALEAEHCEIMSDIDGVYTADPRIVENAARLDQLDHETMIALARHGARILHPECVEYASRHQVALFAKATLGPRDDKGTIIRQNPTRPDCPVVAIAHRKQVVQIMLGAEHDAAELWGAMAGAGIAPTSLEADERGAVALVCLDDAHRRELLTRRLRERFGEGVSIDDQGGTVTFVGPGLGEEAALVKQAWALIRSIGQGRADLRLGPMSLTWTVATQDVEDVLQQSHREFIENWS